MVGKWHGSIITCTKSTSVVAWYMPNHIKPIAQTTFHRDFTRAVGKAIRDAYYVCATEYCCRQVRKKIEIIALMGIWFVPS
jgi:hypothetical protein